MGRTPRTQKTPAAANDDEEGIGTMSRLLSKPSSNKKPNNDAITNILTAGHDDDDSSYMHSIMERRRHIKPKGDDDGDRSVATNAPLVTSQRGVVVTSRRTNRRRARSSSSNMYRRPINPIILMVLLGLAANWVANRLLDGLIQTNDSEIIDAAGNAKFMNQEHIIRDHVAHHVGDTAANTDNRAYQSGGEQMIGMLSLTNLPKLSEGTKISELTGGWHTTNIQNMYESILEDENDSLSGGGTNYQDEEIQKKLERLRKGIADMKEMLAATNNNKDVIAESNIEEETTEQQPSSPITESIRFILLRKRLLSLYSEPVPTKPDEYSNSTHPLFNMSSPQFQALNWLANIDKSQITDDDPHVVQRYVLSVLYFSTGGPNVDHDTDFSLKRRGGPWRNPTNFLTPNHECEWKSSVTKGEGRGGGIRRCDADKNVVELSIYNELSGTLPSELGRLSLLRTLYLGRNNLVGTIPTELGMIKPIASISLQYNQLTGEIPQDDLNRIPTLRFLQLEGNPLTGKIKKDDPLCQMRDVHKAKNAETNSGQKSVLRVLSATCIPSVGPEPLGDMLECECCTKCFAKEKDGG
jgi:hypothetical protein